MKAQQIIQDLNIKAIEHPALNANDTIKALDFKPAPDREDSFVIGKVVRVMPNGVRSFPVAHAEIICTECSVNAREGETILVALDTVLDFQGRIEVIKRFDMSEWVREWTQIKTEH